MEAVRSDNTFKSKNEDFRQHFGFLGLMLICGACAVYLMLLLRPILRPFLWALFLVMGLAPAVSSVERWILWINATTCSFFLATVGCFWSVFRWLVGQSNCSRRKEPCCRRDGSKYRNSRDLPATVVGSSTLDEKRSRGARVDPDHEDDDGRSLRKERPRGRCAQFIAHVVAIAIVVAMVVCIIGGFVLLVIQSVLSLQDHWAVYRRGARNVVEAVQITANRVSGGLPKEVADEISSKALLRVEELVSAFAAELFSNVWRFVLEFLMMALYISFWLADPMPVGTEMEELFKRYIILKGLACLGYGICVGLLLYELGIDLAAVFGLAAFVLSFVPEVGAIVAMMLPAPVILFDSRLESPGMTLLLASAAQLGLKFVFANVVEVKLVEADQLMKMHPVIILLAVTFFGFIWGPTGMLLSVPLVAYLKVALLSDRVPPRYRDPVLVLLEGDRSAPAKHARKRREEELEEELAASVGQGHDYECCGEIGGGVSAVADLPGITLRPTAAASAASPDRGLGNIVSPQTKALNNCEDIGGGGCNSSGSVRM